LKIPYTIRVQRLMPLRGFRPGAREWSFAEQDLLNGYSHLMGASVRADRTHPGRQAWKGNLANGVRNPFSRKGSLAESAVPDKQQDSPRGQVGIHRILQFHGNSHRGGGNQVRNPPIARFHDFRRPNQEFAVVFFANQVLEPFLDLPPKMLRVQHVDAAVHEPEAIGGADDGIAIHVQD
jgi:hypothetical protein